MISMTIRNTFSDMAEALSFRLDHASKRALALANPQRLAVEFAALEADPLDREEMQRVAQLMESLRD